MTHGYGSNLRKSADSNTTSHRINAQNLLIESCKVPEEALLKRCSFFEGTKGDRKMISTIRKKEFATARKKIHMKLLEAENLSVLNSGQEDYYLKWKSLLDSSFYGDGDVILVIQDMIRVAQSMAADAQDTPTNTIDGEEPSEASQPGLRLRTLRDVLNRQVESLVLTIRASRTFDAVLSVEGWTIGTFLADCKHAVSTRRDLVISSECGHTSCLACRQSSRRITPCVVEKCNAPAQDFQLILAADFNPNQPEKHGLASHQAPFGRKIADVIRLIEDIKQGNETDQVIIFVQFDDLMDTIATALDAAHIGYYSVSQKEADGTRANAGNNLERFKHTAVGHKDWRRVLMLNSASDSAAGQ
jgi:hypothetical protein